MARRNDTTEREAWHRRNASEQASDQERAGDEPMTPSGQASEERKAYRTMLRPEFEFDPDPKENDDFEDIILGSGCNEVPNDM